jgi:hypothetical protein
MQRVSDPAVFSYFFNVEVQFTITLYGAEFDATVGTGIRNFCPSRVISQNRISPGWKPDFNATDRPRRMSVPSYTSPMPPLPISPVIS